MPLLRRSSVYYEGHGRHCFCEAVAHAFFNSLPLAGRAAVLSAAGLWGLLPGMDVHGRRVTVMGLGHFGGGAAAARWLARREARVTVTDLADETALADSLHLLRD